MRRSGAKEKAGEVADDLKDKAGEVFDDAKATASDLFGDARRYYETASEAARTGASAARLPSSVMSAVKSARDWMKTNPSKAAAIACFVAGTHAGADFSSLEVTRSRGGAGNCCFLRSRATE